MADRYQDRPSPADDHYDRGGDRRTPAKGESDPLAELARLIGQSDPFGSMGRANQQIQPRASERTQYQQPAVPDNEPPPGPPAWMQRARQEAPKQDYPQDYPSAVHPLHRYATPRAAPEPDYDQAPPFADADREPDPSRYDDALYGDLDSDAQEQQYGQAYSDDPHAYQDGYDDGAEEPIQKRRGGMVTVIIVLALAVVGTGAAFAYRTYVGVPRSGEPPIIRADAGPTKIVPTPSDGTAKVPDRMAAGDGAEKIVPREEAPVDVNAKSGPRVVFPPLNQNGSPPSVASVSPGGAQLAAAGNGTLPNNEPRKIKTLPVKGDQPDGAATPVASAAPPPATKPAAAAKTSPAAPRNQPSAANANASSNVPLSLVPQQGNEPAPVAETRTRVAATNPVQAASSTGGSSGGYLVQVSSQRNEADAQASYRALQSKFPAVLGSRSPVIKRADLGDKGVYYRAMVGPFSSSDEASQFCGSLKTAGGQCVVQRN
jgi:sporulation related protein